MNRSGTRLNLHSPEFFGSDTGLKFSLVSSMALPNYGLNTQALLGYKPVLALVNTRALHRYTLVLALLNRPTLLSYTKVLALVNTRTLLS